MSDARPTDDVGTEATTAASRTPLRVSVGLPVGDTTTLDDLVRWAAMVDDAGFDAVNVTDHPAPSLKWLTHGGHSTLDPFVTLAAIAAANPRLRLHFNLLVLPYRNVYLTAKAVASLEQLSGGRSIVGVGAGYLRSEFAALGADHSGRARVTNETLAALRAAWTGAPQGDTGTVIRPVPARQPTIWIGGNSDAAMRRVVAHGNGWSPMPSNSASEKLLGTPALDDNDELSRRVARLHQMAADAGRDDPLDIAVAPLSLSHGGLDSSDGSWDQARIDDEVGAMRAAGATWLVPTLPARSSQGEREWLSRLAEDVVARH